MAVDTTPPPTGARGSSKGLSGWVKKNKLAAGGIAAGAGFLFLSKKGDSGGGGSTLVSDSGPATSPLSDVSNYGPNESTGDGGGEQGTGTGLPTDPGTTTTPDDLGDAPDPADAAPTPITVVVQSPERPEAPDPGPSTPTPSFTETATTQQGVTLAGHFFPGATGSTMTGSGSNQYGKYMVHRVAFPGRMEYWWHYTSGSASGKWTGPHSVGEHTTNVQASQPHPTVSVIPGSAVANPGGGGGGGGGSGAPAPAREQPHMGPNIFYNADRNLRYIIQRHSNNKTYRHYESKLNKGDWGSGAGPGVIPT